MKFAVIRGGIASLGLFLGIVASAASADIASLSSAGAVAAVATSASSSKSHHFLLSSSSSGKQRQLGRWHEKQVNPARDDKSPVPAPAPVAAQDEPNEAVHFGDTVCPCIGFDNVEGTTMVTLKLEEEGERGKVAEDGEEEQRKTREVKISYRADLGAHCEPWDKGVHPFCKGGRDPSFCMEKWCYVDPCNCKIPTMPKMSIYLPDVTYRGKPLAYSYATCGGEDKMLNAFPEVGSPGCRCIGFDHIQGSTEITFRDGRTAAYPAEIGSSCEAWDRQRHPECFSSDKPPPWCANSWCYVDPCSCSLADGVVPKISAYLPKATFTGKNLYYSYETCGNPDVWTKENNPEACVNQKTEDACVRLSRCSWSSSGKRCLGFELVHHPLCEGVLARLEGFSDEEKSHASLTAFPTQIATFTSVVIAASIAMLN